MRPTNNVALKEWAVVCAALATGRQQILFRKGGIHEGPDGFRPEQSEFWLFPTGFHQTGDGIRPEFLTNSEGVLKNAPRSGVLPIQHYCQIEAIHWVDEAGQLEDLRSFHILTDEAVAVRFHYRRPGLFVLVLRTWSLPEPFSILLDARYDGCRSWVTLNDDLSTRRLSPIETPRAAEEVNAAIERALK